MPKKRSPGDGGLYKLKSRDLWRGVIDVGFDADGKRIQKYVHAKSQAEARAKLKTMRDEIEQHGAPIDKRVTVAQYSELWLEQVCKPSLKPNTTSRYRSLLQNWVIPQLGRKSLSAVQPSDVRSVYQAIAKAGRSSSTALKVHNIMSGMFEQARLDGAASKNVIKDVRPPKEAVSNRDAFSTEDAIRLLQVASSHYDGTRWWAALLAGIRQGERSGATLDSVNFEAMTFTVQWSLSEVTFEHGCGGECSATRGGLCPDRRLMIPDGMLFRQLDGRLCLLPPKSGKPRTFPMIPEFAEALRRYLDATADIPNPHGLIWRNLDGSPITAGQDADAWRELLFETGLITEEQAKRPKDREPGTPEIPTGHWARHTTATLLGELGVPEFVIGEIVGHVSARTTGRYQHASSESARRAMESLGAHLADGLKAIE